MVVKLFKTGDWKQVVMTLEQNRIHLWENVQPIIPFSSAGIEYASAAIELTWLLSILPSTGNVKIISLIRNTVLRFNNVIEEKWRFEHRWLEKNDVPDILKTAHNAMRFKLWGYLQLGLNKLLMLLEGNMNINSDQLSKTDYQEYDQEIWTSNYDYVI